MFLGSLRNITCIIPDPRVWGDWRVLFRLYKLHQGLGKQYLMAETGDLLGSCVHPPQIVNGSAGSQWRDLRRFMPFGVSSILVDHKWGILTSWRCYVLRLFAWNLVSCDQSRGWAKSEPWYLRCWPRWARQLWFTCPVRGYGRFCEASVNNIFSLL